MRTMRLRNRLGAVALALTTSVGAGVVASAAPAAAHQDHKYAYTFGSLSGCQGTTNLSGYRYVDYGSDHRSTSEVSLVRANHCLRVTTTTWSDNYWVGFRHWVSVTVRDAYGYELWTSPASRFGVDGYGISSFHARRDYYTFDVPQWVADLAASITINNWRN